VKTPEAPGKGWQEDLSVSGAATVIIHRCIEADESDSEGECSVDVERVGLAKNGEKDEKSIAASLQKKKKVNTTEGGTTKGAAVKKDSKVIWSLDLVHLILFKYALHSARNNW
jgi:hypothetical protein